MHSHSTTTSHKSLKIELYPAASENKIPRLTKTHLMPKKKHYLELELFKQQILGNGDDFYFQTFSVSSKKVSFYRTIFFLLGVIFIFMAVFSMLHHIRLFSSLFGNVSFLAKSSLAGISFIFAFLAIGLGYSFNTAKEAGSYISIKTKRKLKRLYCRKRLEKGLRKFNFVRKNFKIHTQLKEEYMKIVEKIEEQKEHTIALLQKIQKFATVDPSYRELLFNQALADMNDKLQLTLRSFEQS